MFKLPRFARRRWLVLAICTAVTTTAIAIGAPLLSSSDGVTIPDQLRTAHYTPDAPNPYYSLSAKRTVQHQGWYPTLVTQPGNVFTDDTATPGTLAIEAIDILPIRDGASTIRKGLWCEPLTPEAAANLQVAVAAASNVLDAVTKKTAKPVWDPNGVPDGAYMVSNHDVKCYESE